MTVDLGTFYREARERIIEFVLGLDPSEYWTAVPATPDWTVHDVVAHLRGVVEDGTRGNMEGAPGEAWTAAQIGRGADVDTQVLLEDWAAESPMMEGFLTAAGPESMAGPAVFDVHTHELDLRGAFGRPLWLPPAAGAWMITELAIGLVDAATTAGVPSLRIATPEGDGAGADGAEVTLRVPRVELFRARFGRRCPDQMAQYDWGGADPSPYIELMPIFGPRPVPLVETLG